MNKPELLYFPYFKGEMSFFTNDIQMRVTKPLAEKNLLEIPNNSEVICFSREAHGQRGFYAFIVPIYKDGSIAKPGFYYNKNLDKIDERTRAHYKMLVKLGGELFPRVLCAEDVNLREQRMSLDSLQGKAFENLLEAYLNANRDGLLKFAIINGPERERDSVLESFLKIVEKIATPREIKSF